MDQTKAFDRLNLTFMLKALEKFGFGDSFINWIKTLYYKSVSKICTTWTYFTSIQPTEGRPTELPFVTYANTYVNNRDIAMHNQEMPQYQRFPRP